MSPPTGRALRELLLLPLTPLLDVGGARGVRRGVSAFGASSASAAVGLGARLLRALQVRPPPKMGTPPPPSSNGTLNGHPPLPPLQWDSQ